MPFGLGVHHPGEYTPRPPRADPSADYKANRQRPDAQACNSGIFHGVRTYHGAGKLSITCL